jgi:hypothetical protein
MSRNKFTQKFLQYYFKLPPDAVRVLGKYNQKGAQMAVVYLDKLWQETPMATKILNVLKFNWIPSEAIIAAKAKEVFMDTVFGTEHDYGHKLYELMAWHNSRKWELKELTETDLAKVEALNGVFILTRLRHKEVTSDYLRLNLAKKAPMMVILVHPLVVKIPVVSLQYALEIDAAFAFNSIREAQHPFANDLIAFIYETIFIQQKIATSLHQIVKLIHTTLEKSDDAVLLTAEFDAIKEVAHVVSDLKAMIEKMMSIIALTYEETKLDTKKTHVAKLTALERIIPEKAKQQFYYQFIFNQISSEAMQELNNLRTGLMHKKGVSSLQPHSFLSKKAVDAPLLPMFDTLMEQHSKNTAVFLGVLALLTDDLSVRKPHGYELTDIPI